MVPSSSTVIPPITSSSTTGCHSRQIKKDDGTCHTCEKYLRPQLSRSGTGKMECLPNQCDRVKREKLNGDGTCAVCPVGFITSSCGKFCVGKDDWMKNDLVWPEDPEPKLP